MQESWEQAARQSTSKEYKGGSWHPPSQHNHFTFSHRSPAANLRLYLPCVPLRYYSSLDPRPGVAPITVRACGPQLIADRQEETDQNGVAGIDPLRGDRRRRR
ncbi:hypothetical protein HPB50_005878 [Hyalomma asiaticum]|uniref:Uncharacterized protein n=1 Tax=Hyalomma asiaticum TaxID=266040 RepID=A0ACB7S4D9_HYAAI|nr:hypothetical protein HPB50_005878 [Hyalomma asiaticum]